MNCPTCRNPINDNSTVCEWCDAIINKTFTSSNAVTENFATLYIYRPWKFVGAAMSFKIQANDIEICKVSNKFATIVKLHKEEIVCLKSIGLLVNNASVTIDVKFKEVYYLKCELNMGLFLANVSMKIVDKNIGQSEYSKI